MAVQVPNGRALTCRGQFGITALAIRFAPVPDRRNVDKATPIINRVDHPILADTNAPEVILPLQLARTDGTRIVRKRLNARKHPGDHRRGERFKLFSRRAREGELISVHSSGVFRGDEDASSRS